MYKRQEYVHDLDTPPPDPVIVMLYVPVGVEELVVIVIVLVAVGELGLTVTELGLKLAEAPLGRPEAERLMVLEFTPLTYVTVTVAETLPPCGVEPLLGETDIEKVKKFAVSVFGPSIVSVSVELVPETVPVHASNE